MTGAATAPPAVGLTGATVVLPSGQLRLVLPGVPRRPHPTGQQEPCVRCAAAGRTKLGVSREGAGSPALCWPCWRGEQQRRVRDEARRLEAQAWDEVGAAAAAEVCPVCQPGPAGALPAVEDLLPGPAPDVRPRRRRRDEQRARQAMAPTRGGCWWCGDRSWLDSLRWQFEQDQAAAAEAEAARIEAEFERIAAVAKAEATVADLAGWIERLRGVLTGYRRGNGWGRAVELAADAFARLDAARTSCRGRPPVVPRLVAALLAADSDYRSGRRALPGRLRTAWLIGRSDRAVYDAWQLLTGKELAWAVRTRIGGRNSLERRIETGRPNDRAEFDVRPLAHSPIDPATRAACVPEALTVLGQLLEHAQGLLDAAQADLDGLTAPTGRVPDWGDQARRARDRQATRRVLAATATPEAAAKIARNICRPHPVSEGEYLSSCSYWGLRFSAPIMIHSRHCRAGLPAGGRREDGASRSPTRRGSADLERCGTSPARPEPPSLRRPRTAYAARATSRPSRPRVRPSWTDWAYDLARTLIPRLPWLAGLRLPAVAATLGARLGPDWTAAAVLAWLGEARTRPLLDDPDDPLAYLAAVLDQALTVEDLVPPYPARAHTEHRRRLAVEQRDAARARLGATLAEFDARDAAAAAASGSGLAAYRAARARLAATARPPQPRSPIGGRGHVDRVQSVDVAGGQYEPTWPDVAQPGGGLPTGWRPGTDRANTGPDAPAAAPAAPMTDDPGPCVDGTGDAKTATTGDLKATKDGSSESRSIL